jgi:hypothetical protein
MQSIYSDKISYNSYLMLKESIYYAEKASNVARCYYDSNWHLKYVGWGRYVPAYLGTLFTMQEAYK